MRLALGVSRARLAGMLLMESLLIVCIGAAGSIVLKYRVPLMILNAMAPGQANFAVGFSPDLRVFGFLMILMAAGAILSSLVPIRAAWKLDLLTALKGRETTGTVRSRATIATPVKSCRGIRWLFRPSPELRNRSLKTFKNVISANRHGGDTYL